MNKKRIKELEEWLKMEFQKDLNALIEITLEKYEANIYRENVVLKKIIKLKGLTPKEKILELEKELERLKARA
jgi:hypothetical protein